MLICLVGVVPVFFIPNNLPNLLFMSATGNDLIKFLSNEFTKSLYFWLENVPMSFLSLLKYSNLDSSAMSLAVSAAFLPFAAANNISLETSSLIRAFVSAVSKLST